jgi:cytochrome b
LRRGQHPAYVGHNPLGALMMLALMGIVLLLAVTGWLQTTDAFFGEEWLMALHAWLANGLLVAAGLHAAAAILMGRLERVHLVRAMVTGVKQSY